MSTYTYETRADIEKNQIKQTETYPCSRSRVWKYFLFDKNGGVVKTRFSIFVFPLQV